MPTIADMKNQQQNTQVATRKSDKDKTIFEFLSGDPKIEKAIQAVAGSYFTADRFLRLAINAIKKTPTLAYCDPQSVLGAFMTSAALGLEPNTILQQAFLIPYKKSKMVGNKWENYYECNFQVGARGFITLAHRSPYIKSIESEAIHENDHWKHMKGTKSFLEYEKKLKDRGGLAGAFCYTVLESGLEMATVLPLDEVYKIRSKSETYNALLRAIDEAGSNEKDKQKAQKKFAETPWVMWEDDMSAKSATKKHSKQLPISPNDAFAVAAQIDSDDGNVIDMASMADPDVVRAVMKEGVDAAGGQSEQEYNFPAVENDPSPTLEGLVGRAANAETVEVNTHAHNNDNGQQRAAAAQVQQQSAQSGQSPSQKLQHRLDTLTDTDMLDAEADLIDDMATSPEQAEQLRATYKKRRAELVNGKPGNKQASARPNARQMTID
jgi:recombination protein RecT